jgi:protein gp37
MDNRHLVEKVSHWGKGAPRLKGNGAVKLALSLNRKPWVCDNCHQAFKSPCHHFPLEGDTAETANYCPNIATGYHRRRIFSLSRGDWLDEEVPVELLAEMLDTIRRCADCDWLLLTKRPENWRKRIGQAFDCFESGSETSAWLAQWVGSDVLECTPLPPQNIWIGTSVENQDAADQRIPLLLKIPAIVRFLSCEPLLGPVKLPTEYEICRRTGLKQYPFTLPEKHRTKTLEGIHWVIAGGESGAKARPMHPDWVRSLRDQCAAAGVAFHFKQWGEFAPTCAQYPCNEKEHDEAERAGNYGDIALEPSGEIAKGHQPISNRTWLMSRVGKKKAGRMLDGVEHNGFPTTEGSR